MSAHSSPQGTTRSISTRNCARRVIFAYFSNPEPASVICLLFIPIPRSCLLSAEALHFRQVNSGLVQRFPKPPLNVENQRLSLFVECAEVGKSRFNIRNSILLYGQGAVTFCLFILGQACKLMV